MPKIDQFIDFMVKNRGQKLIIPERQKCQLEVEGQLKDISTILNEAQIRGLLSEVISADRADALRSGEDFSFTHPFHDGIFDIRVQQGKSLSVTILHHLADSSDVSREQPEVENAVSTTPEACLDELLMDDRIRDRSRSF